MSDVHAELLAATTLMEQHYAVFAQARTVAAALKTAADEEAAVKAAVTAQQEALATLRLSIALSIFSQFLQKSW